MSSIAQRLVAVAWLFAGAVFWAGVTAGVAIQLVRELARHRPEQPIPQMHMQEVARRLPARFAADDLAMAAPGWKPKANAAAEVQTEVTVDQIEDVMLPESVHFFDDHVGDLGIWATINPTPGMCWREMKEAWN